MRRLQQKKSAEFQLMTFLTPYFTKNSMLKYAEKSDPAPWGHPRKVSSLGVCFLGYGITYTPESTQNSTFKNLHGLNGLRLLATTVTYVHSHLVTDCTDLDLIYTLYKHTHHTENFAK